MGNRGHSSPESRVIQTGSAWHLFPHGEASPTHSRTLGRDDSLPLCYHMRHPQRGGRQHSPRRKAGEQRRGGRGATLHLAPPNGPEGVSDSSPR